MGYGIGTNMILIDNELHKYQCDEDGLRQGEYVNWHRKPDSPCVHCFFKDDKRHGEFKSWTVHGNLHTHRLYIHGKKYHVPIHKITPHNKMKLTLKYELQWLT